ncbi:MAG: NAD-dependent epimerase/dehydratase family protein [Deltaproteobacteria bacterium]|nr:NAD-dependent epimerase/dehydratase family protein [Deltaproteobacteria bacterium]
MRIAISGGAGFIGSHLAEQLLAQGHDVLCLDSFDRFYPAPIKIANLKDVLSHPRLTLCAMDLCESEALDEAIGEFKPEALVHLAANAGVRPSIERPLLYVRANIEATQKVLTSCTRHGVARVVLAGSSSVYGKDQPSPFVEEHASGEPQSPYAATKRAMELLGAAHASVHGATVTVCRFFTVYGPRQRPDLAISRFVRAMMADKPIRVFGDGTFARDFTYVDDTVAGIQAALRAPSGYRIYNIGAGHPTSVNDLVETIERVMGKKAIIERAPVQVGDVPLTFASAERAYRELGWRAQVGLEEGIRRFVAWARSAPEVYFRAGEPWGLPPPGAQ